MMDRDQIAQDEASARKIAEEIAKFREEFWNRFCTDIENELDEIERSGYDPALGTGRGAKWAEGA